MDKSIKQYRQWRHSRRASARPGKFYGFSWVLSRPDGAGKTPARSRKADQMPLL